MAMMQIRALNAHLVKNFYKAINVLFHALNIVLTYNLVDSYKDKPD